MFVGQVGSTYRYRSNDGRRARASHCASKRCAVATQTAAAFAAAAWRHKTFSTSFICRAGITIMPVAHMFLRSADATTADRRCIYFMRRRGEPGATGCSNMAFLCGLPTAFACSGGFDGRGLHAAARRADAGGAMLYIILFAVAEYIMIGTWRLPQASWWRTVIGSRGRGVFAYARTAFLYLL